jgi:hypothetical protein
MGTIRCGKTLYVVQPITLGVCCAEVDGVKMPAHPRVLALLAAILPVMRPRTRCSAAWILVTALSATFWTILGMLVLFFLL